MTIKAIVPTVDQLLAALEAHSAEDVLWCAHSGVSTVSIVEFFRRDRFPAVKNAFSDIDEEIDAVIGSQRRVSFSFLSTLARLRSHRNRSCARNGLPVETLMAIFQFAGRCGEDLPVNNAIASVCSHWREIAMDNPLMWSCYGKRALYLNEHYLKLLFERASPYPLSVYPILTPRRLMQAGVFCNYMDRFKVLGFEVNYVSGQGQVHPVVDPTMSASLLEELTVSVGIRRPEIIISCLPFIRDTPRLKSLELRGTRLPWNSAIYRCLVRLKIEGPLRPIGDSTIDGDILDVFRNAPNLEDLDLCLGQGRNRLLLDHDRSTPISPPIPVDNLRTLKLSMGSDLLLHIIRGISLSPRLRKLELHLSCNELPHLEELLSPATLPPFLFQNLRTLELKYLDYATLHTALVGSGHEHDGEYALRIEVTSQSRTFLALHRMIPRQFAMPALEELELHDSSGISTAESAPYIIELLPRLASLSSISLIGRGLAASFPHLRRALDAANTPPSSWFPKLQQITISNTPGVFGVLKYPGSVALEDLGDVVEFLRPFTSSLLRLRFLVYRFHCSRKSSRDMAVAFIEAIRDWGIPDVWWLEEGFAVVGSGAIQSSSVVRVQEIWPEGEGPDSSSSHFLRPSWGNPHR